MGAAQSAPSTRCAIHGPHRRCRRIWVALGPPNFDYGAQLSEMRGAMAAALASATPIGEVGGRVGGGVGGGAWVAAGKANKIRLRFFTDLFSS
jgi:hypothetical protein